MRVTVLSICFVIGMFTRKSYSQDYFFQRGEIWFQEILQIRKKNGFFHMDGAIRSYDWFNHFTRYHIRVGGGYRINDKWNVFGMFGYFYGKLNSVKIQDGRINFDANYRTNIFNSRVLFQYRIRQTYRLVFGVEDFEHSLRMRNRCGILVPINHPAIENNTWYYKFEDEIFFEFMEMNPNFLNSNRLISSFGWYLTPNFSLELSYCWETDFLLDDDIIFGNHIIWLKFNQIIDLSGKRKRGKSKEK